MILTCYRGRNADLIQKVSELYFPPGAKIADVTYGNGWFWKKVDLTKYEFYPSDIKTGVDFRTTPYPDNSFDVVVFDPPYTHGGSESFVFSHKYNNAALNGVNHRHVIGLYASGMKECCRILKPGGLCW